MHCCGCVVVRCFISAVFQKKFNGGRRACWRQPDQGTMLNPIPRTCFGIFFKENLKKALLLIQHPKSSVVRVGDRKFGMLHKGS
jgi:hypothetical protein